MTPTPVAAVEHKHPRTVAGAVLACLGVVALTLGVTGSPASAAEGFSIDLYTVVRDDPGTETSLGSWAVPEELQGRACVATSTPENNSSIHPGNNLRIVSTTTVTLVDIEGSGSPVASTDPITLGDQVEVILVMGPDGVYSAGLAISFDCPAPPTTTTTTTTTTLPCEFDPQLPPDSPECVPPTTTTTTTTTTTPQVGNNPPTTSSTTTTTLPCEWDPELEPDDPNCTTTTTENTVEIAPPTTSGTNNNSPTPAPTQLPRTGSANTMLALGALLLLAGGVMVLTTRREHDLV